MRQELLSRASYQRPYPLQKPLMPIHPKKRVILISGPTAVGKTDISLSLAEAIGGEIISADSCQVYRGMDIGTAKATNEERQKIPHHLIDIRDISESFNVREFYEMACDKIEEIIQKDKVPIIVGGSGFYVHVLLYGPPQGPPADKKIRGALEMQMKNLGAEALYEKLEEVDPDYAKTISSNDKHKIIRALEIMTLSGKKVSSFPRSVPSEHSEYDFRCWFLHYPREILYPRIEERCNQMLSSGFLDEVKRLEEKGLRENSSASNAIGYRQALEYLSSNETKEDFESFVRNFKKATRHFAKRQFTWFRKETLFRWIDMSKIPKEDLKELILQDFEQGFSNI